MSVQMDKQRENKKNGSFDESNVFTIFIFHHHISKIFKVEHISNKR